MRNTIVACTLLVMGMAQVGRGRQGGTMRQPCLSAARQRRWRRATASAFSLSGERSLLPQVVGRLLEIMSSDMNLNTIAALARKDPMTGEPVSVLRLQPGLRAEGCEACAVMAQPVPQQRGVHMSGWASRLRSPATPPQAPTTRGRRPRCGWRCRWARPCSPCSSSARPCAWRSTSATTAACTRCPAARAWEAPGAVSGRCGDGTLACCRRQPAL